MQNYNEILTSRTDEFIRAALSDTGELHARQYGSDRAFPTPPVACILGHKFRTCDLPSKRQNNILN